MNYLIGTSYRGSLLGSSKLAHWHVFEMTPKSTLEQIKSIHVYGLGDCQGAFFITHSDEVYNVGHKVFGSRSQGEGNEISGVPLKIDGLSHRKIAKIRVGLDYGIAVSRSGTLYHWGRPVDELQCYGRTLDEGNDHSPHQLVGFCHVAKEAVCGESFFAVLTDNRQVFVTGWIHWNDKFYDKRIISPEYVDIASISCGAQHIAMVSVDGNVFTCGWGGDGQLGYPWEESDGYLHPQKVSLPEPCIQTACGRNSTIFLSRFGSIWACGWNDNFSKLGVSSKEVIVERPLKVQLEGPFKEIASSYWSTCSIYAALSCEESSVFKWGHGCWPSSSKLIENASILDPFIDFPTPHNLGFSELPADEILTSTFVSDFDCYVLSAADILFEGIGNPSSEIDNKSIQSYNIVSKQQETFNNGITCQYMCCCEQMKQPLCLPDSDSLIESKPLENESSLSYHTVQSHITPPSITFLASSRVNISLSLWVLVLTLTLSVSFAILSSLSVWKPKFETATRISSSEPFAHHKEPHTDYPHSKLKISPALAFSRLSRNSRFSDITFKLADGVLSAHKIVLFERSVYFQQILLSNESQSSISMPQYNVRVFEHFMDYIYTRNAPKLHMGSLLSLNDIARNLNEPVLFKYTMSEIKKQITSSSLKDVLRHALETSSVELREVGVGYIKRQISNNEAGMVDLIESLLMDCA